MTAQNLQYLEFLVSIILMTFVTNTLTMIGFQRTAISTQENLETMNLAKEKSSTKLELKRIS